MKYNRATFICSLVFNLDQSWDESNYAAEIKKVPNQSGEYSVYLYSRDGHSHQLIHLAAFACAISNLATDILYRISEYNKATIGEEMVQAIQIW